MTTTISRAQKRSSDRLGGATAVSDLSVLDTAARLLLGRLPETNGDYKVLGSRIGKAGRGKAYSGSYIKYIRLGKQPYIDNVVRGATNLIAELLAKPPDRDYQKVQVRVGNGFNVPKGAIIQRDARTCVCGVTFIPTAWNQINHTTACAQMRARMKKR